MEELLNEQIREQVKEVFANLEHPVQVLFFASKEGCDYCPDTQKLLEEVTALSDLLGLSVFDLETDQATALRYKIDKAPGFTIAAKDGEIIVDYGIRYFGIPSGHEFTSLINDLVMVSSRNSGLSQETADFFKTLEQPVVLQVYTTPT
jgi:glutaredoxin-like protein